MNPTAGTKTGASTSESKQPSTRGWLREKVHEPKRARTVDLVTRAVAALLEANERVSLASISRKTKEIDPDGLGVSESAILNNETAYAHYKQHATRQGSRPKRTPPASKANAGRPRPVNPARDVARVRQRYLAMTKTDLVDRLIAVEHAYSEQWALWLEANDELLRTKLEAPRQPWQQPEAEHHEPQVVRLLHQLEGMQRALDAKEAALRKLQGEFDDWYLTQHGPGLTDADLQRALQTVVRRAQQAEQKLAQLRAAVYARKAVKVAAVSRRRLRSSKQPQH